MPFERSCRDGAAVTRTRAAMEVAGYNGPIIQSARACLAPGENPLNDVKTFQMSGFPSSGHLCLKAPKRAAESGLQRVTAGCLQRKASRGKQKEEKCAQEKRFLRQFERFCLVINLGIMEFSKTVDLRLPWERGSILKVVVLRSIY